MSGLRVTPGEEGDEARGTTLIIVIARRSPGDPVAKQEVGSVSGPIAQGLLDTCLPRYDDNTVQEHDAPWLLIDRPFAQQAR